jgi:hypothetical protein
MNRTLSGDVQFSDGELGISQCVWCRHRMDDGQRCRAFPAGIPEAILTNQYDHRRPYDGDHGVRFEPEVVDIEYIDIEGETEFVTMSPELALAAARSAGVKAGNDER